MGRGPGTIRNGVARRWWRPRRQLLQLRSQTANRRLSTSQTCSDFSSFYFSHCPHLCFRFFIYSQLLLFNHDGGGAVFRATTKRKNDVSGQNDEADWQLVLGHWKFIPTTSMWPCKLAPKCSSLSLWWKRICALNFSRRSKLFAPTVHMDTDTWTWTHGSQTHGHAWTWTWTLLFHLFCYEMFRLVTISLWQESIK